MFIVCLSVVWSLYANACISATYWFSACQFAILLFILCCYYHLILMTTDYNTRRQTMTERSQRKYHETINEYEKDMRKTSFGGIILWLFLFSVKSYAVQPSLGIFWYVWVILILSIAFCVMYYREDKTLVGIILQNL